MTRQDLYRQRAKSALLFERHNIKTYSPPKRQVARIQRMQKYYGVLMPTIYRTTFGVPSLRSAAFLAIQNLNQPMIVYLWLMCVLWCIKAVL